MVATGRWVERGGNITRSSKTPNLDCDKAEQQDRIKTRDRSGPNSLTVTKSGVSNGRKKTYVSSFLGLLSNSLCSGQPKSPSTWTQQERDQGLSHGTNSTYWIFASAMIESEGILKDLLSPLQWEMISTSFNSFGKVFCVAGNNFGSGFRHLDSESPTLTTKRVVRVKLVLAASSNSELPNRGSRGAGVSLSRVPFPGVVPLAPAWNPDPIHAAVFFTTLSLHLSATRS